MEERKDYKINFSNELQILFEKLFNDKETSDMKIIYTNKEKKEITYHVHKLILCSNSPVFKKMITGMIYFI
jgi:hypothetical protein